MPKIEALGVELVQLDVALSDPELYTTRRAEAANLQALRQAKKDELDLLEVRWLELEERRGP